VVAGIFPLENQRKRAGLAAATGDWVLEIEPDERVDSALAWEIRATLKMGAQAGGLGDHFTIPIHNYLGDDAVRLGWAGVLGEAGVRVLVVRQRIRGRGHRPALAAQSRNAQS